MSRQPRKLSSTGCYHVILKGNAGQVLFEDDENFRFFLFRLQQYSRETVLTILAYCLMINHVHLLIFDPHQCMALLVKKLCVSYANYYNKTYERTGHLFHSRYFSEPVEDERYLFTVFRYILNNPVNAEICRAQDYPWSSYSQYGSEGSFVDSSLFSSVIGSREDLDLFLSKGKDDVCMEYDRPFITDKQALEILRTHLQVSSGTVLQTWDPERRDRTFRDLCHAGIGIRQLERLTGIGRGVIRRAL